METKLENRKRTRPRWDAEQSGAAETWNRLADLLENEKQTIIN
jgi:hypothetical protein